MRFQMLSKWVTFDIEFDWWKLSDLLVSFSTLIGWSDLCQGAMGQVVVRKL